MLAACLLCPLFVWDCKGEPKEDQAPAQSAAAAARPDAGQKEYPAPGGYTPKPFKPGQWAKIQITKEGEAPTETTFKIFAQEGSAFWLEMETKMTSGPSISQALIELDPTMALHPDRIKQFRIKLPTGQIQDVPSAILQTAAKPLLDQLASNRFNEAEKAPRADASSKAGHFKGCVVQEEERELLGMKIHLKTWSHPAIPIAGFVRSEGESGGKKITIELLEFGETGAQKSF